MCTQFHCLCSLWIDWPYCTSSFCFRPWMPIWFSYDFWTWMPFFSSSLYFFCALTLKFNAWLHSFSHQYIVIFCLHCCALAIVPNGILHLLQVFNCGEANCVHVFKFNVWNWSSLLHVRSTTSIALQFVLKFFFFFFCFLVYLILVFTIISSSNMCFFPSMFGNLCSIVTIFINPHTFYFLHIMFFVLCMLLKVVVMVVKKVANI